MQHHPFQCWSASVSSTIPDDQQDVKMNFKIAFTYLLACLLAIGLKVRQSVADDNNGDTTLAEVSSSQTSTSTTTLPPLKPTGPSIKNKFNETKNCLDGCMCNDFTIYCSSMNLTLIPNFKDLYMSSKITKIVLSNNSIEILNFNQLPSGSLTIVDLSNNLIKTILSPQTGKKNNVYQDLSKLTSLNLSNNRIELLTNFSLWKMPVLSSLDLSYNPISKLNGTDFNNAKSVQTLNINGIKLKSIDESAFAQLVNLSQFSMRNTTLNNGQNLPVQLLAKNQNIKTIDLSYNGLIEVPFALRNVRSIEQLVLSGNLMTSLRPSDFVNLNSLKSLEITRCPNLTRLDELTFSNLANLTTINISQNPKFNYFSSNAFKSSQFNHTIEHLDLTGNNITTLSDPAQWPSVKITGDLLLAQNPWDCSCELKWLTNEPRKYPASLHCKTPFKYRDMEVSLYIQTIDCDLEESSYQKLFLAMFLIFLIVLTVAVFIQKTDVCHRLQWRDQYGTIYYTKASFPTEPV